MNRNGLKIGEFSRLCRVTVRALRHYEKIRSCQEQLQLLTECKERLTAMIAFQKKLNEMEKIFIDSLPAIIVASHRAVIPSYDELGKLCYMTIGPEMARLGCECPEPGYCYTIEHGGYKKENRPPERKYSRST